MSRNDARARVRRAQAELDAAEQRLAVHWRPWLGRLQQYRLPALIGSGLLGGLAVATVAPKHWARLGAAMFGGTAWLVRSAIGPALLGALGAHVESRPTAARTQAGLPSTPR